ncbi:MAG TPA: hypothetical protein VG871_14950, partial [Vicinamibacterales bacterium]|nr:hypothetical protein [Vicinamibacterales bacterium]
EPLHTAMVSDFGAPGAIIDFQAPLQHTLVPDNMRKKKTFEKMFLEGRPPVSVGVMSSGDIYGGTAVTFGDVLGDKQINFTAASIATYRTFALSYLSIGQRFQYALQGYSQTLFYYGQLGGLFYDPTYAPFISRDQAQSTQTVQGGSAIGIYPLDRYHRVELSAGFMNINQSFNDQSLQQYSNAYQLATTGQSLVTSGNMMPLSVAFVRETTIFRDYGPLAGSTARVSYEFAPSFGGLLSRHEIDAEARHYLRIGSNGVLATRIHAFRSAGDFPGFLYFGGNNDLRGYDYLQFVGQNVVYANAELRFPIIEAALTPIGVIGGIRGVFFAGAGGAWFSDQQAQTPCSGETQGFRFMNTNTENCQVITGYKTDALGNPIINTDPVSGLQTPVPTYGTQQVSGFRLQDGRASYGMGLETFLFGFPIHFDWAWRTLFNKQWENVVFACSSTTASGQCVNGADDFRKPQFSVWIGYDF